MKALTASSAFWAGGVTRSELSCATQTVPERRKANVDPVGGQAGWVKAPSPTLRTPSLPSAFRTCSEEVPPSRSWPLAGDQVRPVTPEALARVLLVAPSVTETPNSVV